MNTRPYLLLTGATGYVGRHLLWQLLQAGYRVGVIARPGREGVAARVAEALAPFGQPDLAQLEYLAGDLTAPLCGLDAAQLQRLQAQPVRALLHCAGLTRFDAHLRAALFTTNLQGTQQAFALAEHLRAGEFHHVSTAFVAGDSLVPFAESDLELGQGFRNPYEESKYEAERFLHSRAGHSPAAGIRIYRPSIVVGGHPLGERNHVSTIYTFIKALRFLRTACLRDLERGRGRFAAAGVRREGDRVVVPLRIALDAQARINLVPVQKVVDGIVQGLTQPPAGCETRSQLGRDFSLGEIRDHLTTVVGVDGTELVQEADFVQRPRTPIETYFARATREYQPYLLAETRFAEAEKDPACAIDVAAITRDYCALAGRVPASGLGELALAALRVDTPEDYFARLLAGNLGESLLRRIGYVDARVCFDIRGASPQRRVLHFHAGQVNETPQATWDFGYELTGELFMDIVRGRRDLRRAFFAGDMRITGNKEAALKFGFLLGEHLQPTDARVIDEVVGL